MPRIIVDGQPAGAGGGLVTGDISKQVPFVEDWAAVGGPDAGTKGSFDTLDFDGAGTTEEGIFFDWQVPDDYDSGNLSVFTVYAMGGSGGGTVRLAWEADIIELSTGAIDSSTYASPAAQVITTASDTNIYDTRLVTNQIEIAEGDFESGDKVQFRIKRQPASDTNVSDFQAIAWIVAYTGQVATRAATQDIVLFEDTDETAPGTGTKGSFATIDFDGSTDEEQKFTFIVPDNWDERSDAQVRFLYAMSSSAAATVILSTEGQLGDISTGALDTLAVEDFTINTTSDTDIHRTMVIRSVPAGEIAAGDTVVLKIKRKGSSDTHTGDWKMISATVVFGVAPRSGFESIVTEEHYLYAHDFEVQAGSPSGEQEAPDFSGDFENWLKMTGNGASEQIDVSFQGRLMSTQSTIKSIKVPYKASTTALTYNLKVYAENAAPSTPVYASGDTAPSGTTRTVLSLTDGDLSDQPDFDSGREGRFFVVVEAKLDAGEILRVGRPFVGLE